VLAVGCSVGLDPPESQRPQSPAADSEDSAEDRAGVAAGDGPAVLVGAEVLVESGFSVLKGRKIGLIANQTSVVGGRHLIDVLHEAPEVELVAVLAPEHGVRGSLGAGVGVDDETDPETGVPVLSLYGETREPTPKMLEGIDTLVYDLQGVGGRFYTYVSTMGLAMKAAAAAGISFVVLDRPDPSGGLRPQGPLLEPDQLSFIGQYPVPSAYAMTPGELARAILGEGWLPVGGLDLVVVPMKGWRRGMTWAETGLDWIAPSPGLQTPSSAVTYLGTVLFEATSISYGGGTADTFEVIGAPWADEQAMAERLNARRLPGVAFEPVVFVPGPLPGRTANPRLNGVENRGVRIRIVDHSVFEPVAAGIHLLDEFHTAWLAGPGSGAAAAADAAANAAGKADGDAVNPGRGEPGDTADDTADGVVGDEPLFFDRPRTMALLAGTTSLQADIEAGRGAAAIAAGWHDGLAAFDDIRRRYLIY